MFCWVRVWLLQAMEYTRRLRDDRGKGNIVVVEDGEENADEMGADEFEVIILVYLEMVVVGLKW